MSLRRPHRRRLSGPEPLPAWCLPSRTFQNMPISPSCCFCIVSPWGILNKVLLSVAGDRVRALQLLP